MNLNPFTNYNEDRECTTDGEAEPRPDPATISKAINLLDYIKFEEAVELRDLFEDEFRSKFRALGMNPDLKLAKTLQYESESPVVFIAMSDIAFGFRREFEYFFRRVGQEIERGKQKRL